MARRAIPMIAFPRVRCMFIYIYNYNNYYILSGAHNDVDQKALTLSGQRHYGLLILYYVCGYLRVMRYIRS